jgi:hypothetical protein
MTLTPEQWNAPSLCTQWRVRDVVAHMFSYDVLTTGALVRILRERPTDRLRAALRFAPMAPPINAAERICGLCLTATDLDWTTGNGRPSKVPGRHCSWLSPDARQPFRNCPAPAFRPSRSA